MKRTLGKVLPALLTSGQNDPLPKSVVAKDLILWGNI